VSIEKYLLDELGETLHGPHKRDVCGYTSMYYDRKEDSGLPELGVLVFESHWIKRNVKDSFNFVWSRCSIEIKTSC
jgi:hypothetical protein